MSKNCFMAAALLTALTLIGCSDFTFPNEGVTKVQGTGDLGEVRFSRSGRSFAFTVFDFRGVEFVFVHNVSAVESAPLSIPPQFTVVPQLSQGEPITILPNGDSFGGSVATGDGPAAFISNATNMLDPPTLPTNGLFQVFLRIFDATNGQGDLGLNELISRNEDGAQANGDCFEAQVNGNGRFVVYTTMATNLISGTANGFRQIYVWDRELEMIELISHVDLLPDPANGSCRKISISTDGRFVLFTTDATNLDDTDTNGLEDVYIFDRTTKLVKRVSDARGGTCAAMSDDGRFVTYQAPDGGSDQIFLRDRNDDSLKKITSSVGNSTAPAISANGRYVTFQSFARDLIAGEVEVGTNYSDIFVVDAATDGIRRVNVDPDGNLADGDSVTPVISADGERIAFPSIATNLLDDPDETAFFDIYMFPNPLTTG